MGDVDAATDEAAADEARRRLREHGIARIAPDDRIGPLLDPDECVIGVRRAVLLERRAGVHEADDGLLGDLYVTSRRLVLLGRVPVEYPLAEVHEIDVVAGGVRLVVGPGRGVDVKVCDPRVLRVEIAAVREAIRLAAGATPVVGQGSLR